MVPVKDDSLKHLTHKNEFLASAEWQLKVIHSFEMFREMKRDVRRRGVTRRAIEQDRERRRGRRGRADKRQIKALYSFSPSCRLRCVFTVTCSVESPGHSHQQLISRIKLWPEKRTKKKKETKSNGLKKMKQKVMQEDENEGNTLREFKVGISFRTFIYLQKIWQLEALRSEGLLFFLAERARAT